MRPDRPLNRWNHIYYPLTVATILPFGAALLGFVGEQLGWWNDTGELLMRAGTASGAVLAAVTLILGASRFQGHETREAVEANDDTLEDIREAL